MNSDSNSVLIRLLPILLLTFALAVGCSDMGDPVSPDNNNGGNNPPPADTLSWTADVFPDIISNSCTSCHGGSLAQSGLDLSSFDSWINRNSLSGNPFVVPGEPDQSELVWRVEGTHSLQRMPLSGQLSANDIEAIRTWISQGAKKN